MSEWWSTNIERDTLANGDWRRVVHTSDILQVVLMFVPPGEQLGWEVHNESDQFFRVEHGKGVFEVGRINDRGAVQVEQRVLGDGDATVIPRRTWHNVVNRSRTHPLQFYTIYGPPHHPRNRVDSKRPIH